MVPETTYATSGDVHIAYQVVGSGIEFADERTAVPKGVPGEWQLFSVR